MKNRTKIIALAAITISILFLAGCWEVYYSRSYINAFYFYDGISVRRATIHSTKWLDLYPNLTKEVGIRSEGSDKELFDDLCDLYGDNTYNRDVSFPGDGYPMASHPPCAAIDVVSNKDFDAEHPAGTSLADVISIRYHSAKKFIDNGYQPQEDPNEECILKPLDELLPTDLTLSIHNIFLIFDKEPDVLDTHELIFYWTTTEGITYTTSYKYDFSLPEGRTEPYNVDE